MADWSELPRDVCGVIGDKFSVAGDKIQFRSVCNTWRSAVPFPQPPWLMLAQDDSNPSTRGFVGLGRHQGGGGGGANDEDQQEVHHFELPEASHIRFVGCTGCWLIGVDGSVGQGRIFLLNPFSRRQIDLPPQPAFDHRHKPEEEDPPLTTELIRDSFIKKVVLSSPSNNCIALAIHHHHYKLAIAKPGDLAWTTVQCTGDYFNDIIFYRGKFYAISYRGILMMLDIGDASNPPKATLLYEDLTKKISFTEVNYLVEWMGELLHVIKYMEDDDDNESYHFIRFELYSFDFSTNKWNAFEKNLGGYSLFLGFNTSVALSTSQYPGLKSGCIYFTDDYAPGYRGFGIPGGRQMGIFDIQDGSVRPHYEGISTSLYSPPIWITPPFTCRSPSQ